MTICSEGWILVRIIDDIERRFNELTISKAEALGELNSLTAQIKEAEDGIALDIATYEAHNEVLDVLRLYSEIKERDLKVQVDQVVTKGLNAIFRGENFGSKLEFAIKRGQATVTSKLVTSIEGNEITTNVEKAESGGVANVVGFLYQLLVLSLKKPRMRQVIFADEPFKNLSDDYMEATGEFIRMLAKRLGIQVVLITHKTQLMDAADVLYKFEKKNGVTKVERIR